MRTELVIATEAAGYCCNSSVHCNYGAVPALRLFSADDNLLYPAGFLVSLRTERK